MPNHIQKLNYSHEAIIDWLIANPDRNQGDCAEDFGLTQAWLSRVVNSDMFQVKYQERLAQKRERLDEELAYKLSDLANKTVGAVRRRIDSGACSDKFLGDTMDRTLAALGFTQDSKGVGPPATTVNVLVDAKTIELARERSLANSGNSPAKIINGEVHQQHLLGKEEVS